VATGSITVQWWKIGASKERRQKTVVEETKQLSFVQQTKKNPKT